MSHRLSQWPRLALPIVVALAMAPPLAAHRSGAPAGYTGGFGEGHCGACHFAGRPADPGGQATLLAPDRYQPSAAYDLTIEVVHPDLAAAGFQLTARFADGSRAGQQAGRLEATGTDVQVTSGPDQILYAGHTETGTSPVESATGRWALRWIAPDTSGTVLFHLAVNAANDDESEFGDHILLAEHRAEPAGRAQDR